MKWPGKYLLGISKRSFGLYIKTRIFIAFWKANSPPIMVVMTVFVWFRAPTNSGWLITHQPHSLVMVGHIKDTYHLAPLATWDPPHSLTESEEIFMSSLKYWHTHWINIFKTPRNILCRQGLLQGKRRLWSHVTRPQECLAALRLQTNSPTWSQVSFCSSGVSDAFLRMNPTPFIALTNWILMFLWWQTSEKCLVWLSKKGNILVYYTKYRRLSTTNFTVV